MSNIYIRVFFGSGRKFVNLKFTEKMHIILIELIEIKNYNFVISNQK